MDKITYKEKVLTRLNKQTQYLDQINVIKLILNSIQYQSTFTDLIGVKWIDGKRVYFLKPYTKKLIKALQGVEL